MFAQKARASRLRVLCSLGFLDFPFFARAFFSDFPFLWSSRIFSELFLRFVVRVVFILRLTQKFSGRRVFLLFAIVIFRRVF